MASSGSKGGRRRVPPASVQTPPEAPAVAVAPMTEAEAAPVLEAAREAADIAAAPLVVTADISPAPVTPPVTPAISAPVGGTPNPDGDPAPADTAAPTAADANKDIIMDATIQNTADKTQAAFADMTDRTRGAVEKGQRFFAELTEFNKGNIEALVESSKIAARALETLGQDAVAEAKASFEGASQAMQTLAAAKSPTEFMKLQADYARSTFDAMVAQTSRRAEASLKLAGEVAQPISNRFALAAEKIKVAA